MFRLFPAIERRSDGAKTELTEVFARRDGRGWIDGSARYRLAYRSALPEIEAASRSRTRSLNRVDLSGSLNSRASDSMRSFRVLAVAMCSANTTRAIGPRYSTNSA